MTDLSKIGEYLKDRRKAAGLTQKQVAGWLGYGNGQYVSNVERGECPPSIQLLKAVVKLYGVNKKKLIDVLIETKRDYYQEKI